MAKDYAKYRRSPHPKKTKENRGGKLVLPIVVVIVVSFVLLGVYAYKHATLDFSRQKLVSWVTQAKLLLGHKKIESSLLTRNASTQQVKQEPEIRFNFYTELPNMQVTLPVTEEVPSKQALASQQNSGAPALKVDSSLPAKEEKKTQTSPEKSDQYILQMGVFKNQTAAGQMRISLLLAGCEADIVKNTEENQTVYRLQKGPYSTLAQVKEVQKQLQNKGVTGLIKKIKSQKG